MPKEKTKENYIRFSENGFLTIGSKRIKQISFVLQLCAYGTRFAGYEKGRIMYMRINGFNAANTQTGTVDMVQANDSVSRNIQNQIVNAQQKLQDLASNEEMSLEDKMKKRQEIQQEINNLNQQLRQHQIEQRSRKQSKNVSSMDDMMAGTNDTSAGKGAGLSQAGMQAMISADSSMKQARVQGKVATQLEGKSGVLASEIKMDKGRGAGTEKKEAELADLQAKTQSATAAQMSTLADAKKSMEEVAKADNSTQDIKTKKTNAENAEKAEKAEKTADTASENADVAANTDTKTETLSLEIGQNTSQQIVYTKIDVLL